jgi:hypothetical protein
MGKLENLCSQKSHSFILFEQNYQVSYFAAQSKIELIFSGNIVLKYQSDL